MPCPLLVHVHGGGRKGPGDVAHPAGVVEVDVGDGDPGQLGGPDADLVERGEEDGHRALAARLDQDRGRTLDEIAGRHPIPATQPGVDLEHAGRDGHRWRDGGDGVAALGVVSVKAGVGMAVAVTAVGMRVAHGDRVTRRLMETRITGISCDACWRGARACLFD